MDLMILTLLVLYRKKNVALEKHSSLRITRMRRGNHSPCNCLISKNFLRGKYFQINSSNKTNETIAQTIILLPLLEQPKLFLQSMLMIIMMVIIVRPLVWLTTTLYPAVQWLRKLSLSIIVDDEHHVIYPC